MKTGARRSLSVELDERGHIATVTLTRPDQLNVIDDALHEELAEILLELRQEATLRAVLLASTGRVFSAGGGFEHILEVNADAQHMWEYVDRGRLLINALNDVPVPIVAAVEGEVVGLATSIVLGCDAVVAHPGVGLADPHVVIGLVAGDGGCVYWPQTAGMLLARRYLLTGERMPAELAYQHGLVSDLVAERNEVMPRALEIARKMASLPPIAVRGTKRALNAVVAARTREVLDMSFYLEAQSVQSADVLEAVAAFKQKRPATFTGS